MTDMATAGAGAPQGIVRFDSDGNATRFATGISPQDLNIGQDGRLYALADDEVHVWNPASLAFQYSIDLDATIAFGDYRAVAANVAGELCRGLERKPLQDECERDRVAVGQSFRNSGEHEPHGC